MMKEKIEQAKLKYVKNNLETYQKNKELITMYDNYINNIVELFDYIKKDDTDLFYTIVFAILIEIGFFSADRKFNSNEIDKELTINPGINVIVGNGVCRNIACFYEDVFSYYYNYPLKLCCLDTNGILNEDSNKYGNHIINLTRYHDIIYGFDILNKCLFKAKDKEYIEGVDINYTLKYMPYGDLLLELVTCLNPISNFPLEVKLKQQLLEKATKNNILSIDEYRVLIQKANEFIIERKKILQSFILQNEELTHEIKKKMLNK